MRIDALPSNELIEWELPATEALLAGVLALMTAHAQSSDPVHRSLMAGKAVQNLRRLACQGAWSENFRRMLQHVEQHWAGQSGSGTGDARPARPMSCGTAGERNHAVVRQVGDALGVDNARALWHIAPELMQ